MHIGKVIGNSFPDLVINVHVTLHVVDIRIVCYSEQPKTRTKMVNELSAPVYIIFAQCG